MMTPSENEHRMNQLAQAVMDNNALDMEWNRLIATGNDRAIDASVKLSRAKDEMALALAELRDMARMSLAETNTPQGANHYLEGASKPRNSCQGHYPTESDLTFGDSLQPTFCEGECERPNSSADADTNKKGK